MVFAQFVIHVQTKFCQSTACTLVAKSQKNFRKRRTARIWKKIHELAKGMLYCVPSLEECSCQVLEQKQVQALQRCGLKNF